MAAIFKKLNLKDGDPVLVLNAPASFEPELAALPGGQVAIDADWSALRFRKTEHVKPGR